MSGADVLPPVISLRSWQLLSTSYGGKTVKCLYRLFVVTDIRLMFSDAINAIR